MAKAHISKYHKLLMIIMAVAAAFLIYLVTFDTMAYLDGIGDDNAMGYLLVRGRRPVSTKDWKTYSSSFGYSIKYPETWVLNSTDPKKVTINSPENSQRIANFEAQSLVLDTRPLDDVLIDYDPSGAVPQNFKTPNITYRNIQFAGQTAYAGITPGSDKMPYVIMLENDGLYTLSFGVGTEKLPSLDKAIADSFQFSAQTTPTELLTPTPTPTD